MDKMLSTSSSSQKVSLTTLPADVVRGVIFDQLSLPNIVACYFVCVKFRGYSHGKMAKSFTCKAVLSHLFQPDNICLLPWFNSSLLYPAQPNMVKMLIDNDGNKTETLIE